MRKLIQLYANRRMAALLALGFASGLPLALVFATLQAWMTDLRITVATIGVVVGLVKFPYAFKFLWSPLMDRFVPPFLGRRRGWLLVTQGLLIVGIAAMALVGGQGALVPLAIMAVAVAFCSASQDIVADAYRTDLLDAEERGAGAAVFVTGYRIGLTVSMAGALYVAGHFHVPWPTIYLVMAGLMGVGVVASIFAPEPKGSTAAPGTLREAVVEPLRQFVARRDGWLVAAFILLFKLPEVMVDLEKIPFLMAAGVSKEQLAVIVQGLGMAMTIVGAMAGGWVVARLGLWKSLWVFGVLGAISNLGFWYIAVAGSGWINLVTAVSVEHFCAGLVTAGFVAFLMSQCDRRYSATQFALLSSLMALTSVIGGGPLGAMAQHMGWSWFFAISVVAIVPAMAMLPWIVIPDDAVEPGSAAFQSTATTMEL
ncbi:MAG: MFS transporter [Phycisphaerales bacterium]|nr:MFS transporter [Phycisphaerales bacterium]